MSEERRLRFLLRMRELGIPVPEDSRKSLFAARSGIRPRLGADAETIQEDAIVEEIEEKGR